MQSARLIAALAMLAAPIAVIAAPPAAIEGLGYKLTFQEDCDASLAGDWNFENGKMDQRPYMRSARWERNITTANGHCKITQRREESLGKRFTSGYMWSKKEYLYGYFEARMEFGAASGVDNAFWLMASTPGPGPRCEIDVIEGSYPNVATNNLHVIEGPKKQSYPGTAPSPQTYGKGYHSYGVLWTKDVIRWYYDGQVVREQANHPCHDPLAVRVSTAVVGGSMGPVTDAIDGTVLSVDHVRIYQLPEQDQKTR